MLLYKKNSNLYLYYVNESQGFIVKMQSEEQFDWFCNRFSSVFYGMLDEDPSKPADENILKQINKWWPLDSDHIPTSIDELESEGYENISERQKQSAKDAIKAMRTTIERSETVEGSTNGGVMQEFFAYIKDGASAYDRDSGTTKYQVLIMACDFLCGNVESEAFQMINLLRTFSSYPNFTDAAAIKNAPCGCGGGSFSMTGMLNALGGMCDINSMWKMWMLNIIFYYITSPEFWLDIKAYDPDWSKLKSILMRLKLKDYVGCSCKDLTNSYSITSGDILRFLDLLAQLGDCPSNVTFMWRTLAVMIFTQLFNILYIQNPLYGSYM